MTGRFSLFRAGLLLLAGVLLARGLWAQTAPAAQPPLPYRFLVVVQDQWQDPASEIIDGPSEFSVMCALLRSWGVPYDIYRLDQQRFDAYHLLDRGGRSRYSTLIWDAPGAQLAPDGEELLRSLIQQQGVGLVAFSDALRNPAVAAVAGATAEGGYRAEAPLALLGQHFITRGQSLEEPADRTEKKLRRSGWNPPAPKALEGTRVTLQGAQAIVRRGDQPFLTVHAIPGGGRVAWLDADRASLQLNQQVVRNLFRRSLIWANHHALLVEYPRSAILFMDDMGSSDKTYYPDWHYPSLSEETIRTRLIEPLQKHHAVLVENVNTGYVDRRTHRILNPWTQRPTDELDPAVVQDFTSTKRGLDAGIKAGVFDIQSHGWTHMAPDLDSAPGPLWSAPPKGEVVQLNWYKEFYDVVRKREIPAIVQREHLQRSLECLAEDFGIRPVAFRAGGTESSRSPANHSMRIAAKLGFGIGEAEANWYLDHQVCLILNPISPAYAWNYTATLRGADIPWSIDAPTWIGFHDHDVAMDGPGAARLLDDLGTGIRYLSCSEYSAYLHATVERDPASATGTGLRVRYDEHYCKFFQDHASQWVLYSADESSGDGRPASSERRVIEVPAGLGAHRITP